MKESQIRELYQRTIDRIGDLKTIRINQLLADVTEPLEEDSEKRMSYVPVRLVPESIRFL